MKDRLFAIVKDEDPVRRPAVFREFLQCMTLRALHEGHDFGNLAFIGGTALRLIFDLPRFSEDLDFSLVNKATFEFSRLEAEIGRIYAASGIAVELKRRSVRTVQSLWLKFPRLLHEAGLTTDPRRVISIKLEVDTNPPEGAHIERRLINRHFPIAVVHYDLPSLFAGKLHAVLTRQYVKGRDYFDLVWYRTRHRHLVPNLDLLNAALTQTGWKRGDITQDNWKQTLRKRVSGLDWKLVVRDVSPFLEDAKDLDSMRLEYVLPLFEEP
jgi:predicted nucleotidyltransferase component of viral defense system